MGGNKSKQPAKPFITNFRTKKEIKKENYKCDTLKEQCKINFDLRKSFTWTYKESDFRCEIDFGFWSWNLTWQEQKCNPITIIFPTWEYEINFKIINKDDENIFSTKTIKIENQGYLEPVSNNNPSWWGWGAWWWEPVISLIDIQTPEIEIQSWLELSDWGYRCKKEDCKVNLGYTPLDGKEKCLWSFNWWNYSNWTLEKCNPWYVHYSLWTYEIKLKVYQDWKESNYKEIKLNFKKLKEKKAEKEDEKAQKEKKNEEN